MLEIAQTGQAGKTHLLFDMHRLRKRVFKDRMKWNVDVSPEGLEVDQFDLPETVYILALDNSKRVIGNWRLLPTTGPTMIRDIWPDFLKSLDMPRDPRVWESSRFSVDSLITDPQDGLAQVQRATEELFCGAAELCVMCGITSLYAMHDDRIIRLLSRLNCQAEAMSAPLNIDGIPAQVGAYLTNATMLESLRRATGIFNPLLSPDMLPPILRELYDTKTCPSSTSLASRPLQNQARRKFGSALMTLGMRADLTDPHQRYITHSSIKTVNQK